MPQFAPALGYARQHFFYVVPDDLELLHALLKRGIEQAGQWKTVSGTPLAEKLGALSKTSREIDSRVRLLEVFCEAWKQGRGRAVDRDALVESRALSERYLEDVVAIAGKSGGGADQLLKALHQRSDSRLKGFRRSSADALEEFLRDNGYLDDRRVLDESYLRLLVLASPPANVLPDEVTTACLSRWWAWAVEMSEGGQ